MRIGIVSDTHSRHATVGRVVELLRAQRVDLVLHCGDIEDGPTVELFGGFPTHFVLGNCDADEKELRQAMEKIGAVFHQPFGNLELAGRKIAWLHGDDKSLLRDLENSGHFDYLFYGHTHHSEKHRTGDTLVVNPGALHRARPKTCVVLDLDRDELQSIELPLS